MIENISVTLFMTRVDREGNMWMRRGGDMNMIWRKGVEEFLLVVCYFCTAKQSDSDDRYCNMMTTHRTLVAFTTMSGSSRSDNFKNLPFLLFLISRDRLIYDHTIIRGDRRSRDNLLPFL